MVNWCTSPDRFASIMPAGCEIDHFQGKTYVSLVAFLFENTRVLGVGVPGHRNFEEVNLRFYVTRTTPDGEKRRGVVFIREFVPKHIISWVARTFYQEPYETIAMSHQFKIDEKGKQFGRYQWGDHWISGHVGNENKQLEPGSIQHFIAEHYWGYTKTNRGTREYRVEHPTWHWRDFDNFDSAVDYGALYGSQWSFLSTQSPECVFMAEGSGVSVEPWGSIKGI